MSDVINDRHKNRYELTIGKNTAHADYRIDHGTICFFHTIVPAALEGQGVGSKLAHGALSDAKKQGLKIVAQCSFIEHYLTKHPEFAS